MTRASDDHGERIASLCGMLSQRRPAGRRQERRFIRDWILPLGNVHQDEAGNLWRAVGESPRVLWSCHTDTVHRDGGRQRLAWDGARLKVAAGCKSNCLGADDTAGVWLARELIVARVPGLYVFHRGEEIGGIGSRWVAKNSPGKLAGIAAAVAFDRRGTGDVITHQAYGRTASDDFAKSFAAGLALPYKPAHGIFTDTANYTDLIGECSNISVGFDGEHTAGETLDVAHLIRLRAALIALDQNRLAFVRKPGERDTWDDDWGFGSPYSYGGGYGSRTSYGGNATTTTRGKAALALEEYDDLDDLDIMDVRDLVERFPDIIADMIEQWGYDRASLAREIKAYFDRR